MPRRVAAESESEAEAATEKDPGHVAMGEEDTLEALSAAPTTVHASNAPVHAPHMVSGTRTSWSYLTSCSS